MGGCFVTASAEVFQPDNRRLRQSGHPCGRERDDAFVDVTTYVYKRAHRIFVRDTTLNGYPSVREPPGNEGRTSIKALSSLGVGAFRLERGPLKS